MNQDFLIFNKIFPSISQEMQVALAQQLPEDTFEQEEIGYFVFCLVRGVKSGGHFHQVSFNPYFETYEKRFHDAKTYVVRNFVEEHKEVLARLHREICALTKKIKNEDF
ncbi:MAG: hypothetical protein ACYCZ7_01650 [Minisyncoccota bacterium]